MSILSYFLTFMEGILTFISPCILPMLPVYFIYLAGTAESNLNISNDKRNMLVQNSIGFILGFTLVFIILGATATALGSFLDNHREILRKTSGIIMLLFGLYFMGLFKPGFLEKTRRIELHFKKLQFTSSILFGIVFSFSWTPCLGAFLGSALVLAGNSEKIIEGVTLLLVYSLGLGLPFLIAAIIFDKVRNIIKEIQKHSRLIGVISGILLIAAGILIYTDKLKYISL